MNRNKTHDKLAQIVKEAYIEHGEDRFRVPEPDLSFLDEAPLREKKKMKAYGRHVSRVAAAVICVVIIGAGTAVWFNSEGAYGGKTLLNSLGQNLESGRVITETSEEESAEDAAWETSTSITEEEDLDKAKRFIPTLYLPTYLPEGFELEKLDMSKSNEGYMASGVYRSGEDWIMISSIQAEEEDTEYGAESDGKPPIELKDRTIYTGYDEIEDIYSVSAFFKDQLVSISGNISQQEMIEIAKGLEL